MVKLLELLWLLNINSLLFTFTAIIRWHIQITFLFGNDNLILSLLTLSKNSTHNTSLIHWFSCFLLLLYLWFLSLFLFLIDILINFIFWVHLLLFTRIILVSIFSLFLLFFNRVEYILFGYSSNGSILMLTELSIFSPLISWHKKIII